MCSVADYGAQSLKDFDSKHGIHKACFAEMDFMTKHEQLLVCGPDWLHVFLPSPPSPADPSANCFSSSLSDIS